MPWITSAIEAVTGLGSQWMENKQKVRAAKFGLTLAKLEAKTKLVATTQERTFNLDELAVREASKTLWDEFLVCLYLSPFLYTVMYPFFSGKLVDPHEVWDAISQTPTWYKYGLALIGVRYLGFRNLLRYGLETWSKKQ